MKFSIIIPARNEEGCIADSISDVHQSLASAGLEYEIVVVNDHSTDGTEKLLNDVKADYAQLRVVSNPGERGYGMAVRHGLSQCAGDAMIIMMGDGSDSPDDLITYCRVLEDGADCVFGSRFMKGSMVRDYPTHKLIINRIANWFVRMLFRLDFTDVTNAFKGYRRPVIDGIQPLLSCHFNLTVEMPLKAIIRGFSYKVVPISWYGRKEGVSKLRIQEMGSRYLFIVLYCWLEKHLSRGDYVKGA